MGTPWRLAAAIVAVAVAASACGAGRGTWTSPLPARLPRITSADAPPVRAAKLARYIERRWPRVRIQEAEANRDGTLVGFNDYAAYDYSIKDPDEYVQSVRRLTEDLDQASVELLKLCVRFFPQLRYASVWQDRQLQAFWSKEQIVAMDRPEAYRGYKSFLKLIFSAQVPPYGSPPPAPTS
jgi:hypothetical protein